MAKFLGLFQELQDQVLKTGIYGDWRELANGHHQFRADTGASLNWWESKKTIFFQGPQEEAAKFEKKFYSVQPTRKATLAGGFSRHIGNSNEKKRPKESDPTSVKILDALEPLNNDPTIKFGKRGWVIKRVGKKGAKRFMIAKVLKK